MSTKAELQAEVDRLRETLDRHLHPDNHKLVSYVDGLWTFQSPIFPVFVGTMAQMLTEFDAPNYIEIEASDARAGLLTVTVQRKLGKTPHELRQAAEAEVARLRAAINEFFSADEAGGSAERRNDAWDALVRARVAVQQAESGQYDWP